VTPASFSAPGKLLLFGEHSAVFGYPAVGTSIDRGLTITVVPAKTMSMMIQDDTGDAAGDASRTEGGAIPKEALASFARFLAELLPEVAPARITVRSDLPISSGFGSSAALCTAIARWARPGGASDATWQLAHRVEAFFHGTPSGVDTGLTTLGGVRAFHFGTGPSGPGGPSGPSGPGRQAAPGGTKDLPEATALASTLPPLVVGSVPRTRTTRELVSAVRDALEEQPDTIRPVLDRLGEITVDAIAALKGRGTEGDAAAATALAGKPSGAGGGGAFYLVCPDRATADDVLRAVRAVLPPGGVAF
jgi:mevalonate kinase